MQLKSIKKIPSLLSLFCRGIIKLLKSHVHYEKFLGVCTSRIAHIANLFLGLF